MKQRTELVICLIVVSILLIFVLLSYNPELSLSKLVQHHTNENWADAIPDMNEGFVTLNPIAYSWYNAPGSPRYPKAGEKLIPAESSGRCTNYNRATKVTNGIEIPYAGDPRYNGYAQERNRFQEKGLVPPGFNDDRSKNACKITGMQGALPDGTPCVVRIGGRFLGYNKKNNLATLTTEKDNDVCKMLLRYPNADFNNLFLDNDRNALMFENTNGDFLTCGIPWEYGWDLAYYIQMNPEQTLKYFGLLFHPHFSPRRDQWTNKDEYKTWLAIPEKTSETYQITVDRSDPNEVRAFGEAADRKFFMGPWRGGTSYWNNKNAKTNPMAQIFGWRGADNAAGPYPKLFSLTSMFDSPVKVPNQGDDVYMRMGSWNDWSSRTKFEILPIVSEIMVPTIVDD